VWGWLRTNETLYGPWVIRTGSAPGEPEPGLEPEPRGRVEDAAGKTSKTSAIASAAHTHRTRISIGGKMLASWPLTLEQKTTHTTRRGTRTRRGQGLRPFAIPKGCYPRQRR